MSEIIQCSALVEDKDKKVEGYQQVFKCKHGHGTKICCYGISAETVIPTCVDERHFFHEPTKTGRNFYWNGQ